MLRSIVAALVLASLSAASAAAEVVTPTSIYTARQQTAHLPSGRTINYLCTGEGSPTVILTSGLNDSNFVWHGVQPEMSQLGRVCSWDRAGVGFSDASPDEQTAENTEKDLEDWLTAASITGPFIMVGHSMGSFETMVFVERQRSSVVGILLVDPSYPGQMAEFALAAPKAFGQAVPAMMAADLENWRGCLAELKANLDEKPACGRSGPPSEPFYAPVASVDLARLSDIASRQTQLSLMEQSTSAANAERVARALTDVGDLPIIVLTAFSTVPPEFADEGPAYHAAWMALHDRYAALSRNGVNRLIEGSQHYIFETHPEAVIGAVDEIRALSARP